MLRRVAISILTGAELRLYACAGGYALIEPWFYMRRMRRNRTIRKSCKHGPEVIEGYISIPELYILKRGKALYITKPLYIYRKRCNKYGLNNKERR